MFFGDAHEHAGRDDIAAGAGQAQQDLEGFFRFAEQVDDGLVEQHEAFALERGFHVRNPLRDALFLGAITCGRVEDQAAIATFGLGCLQLRNGFVEHLLGTGDLLADLDASQAHAGVERAFACFQDGVLEGLAKILGQFPRLQMVGAQQQHRETVIGETRGDGVVGELCFDALGGAAQEFVGMGQADLVEQSGVVVQFQQQQGLIGRAFRRSGDHRVQFAEEVLAVVEAGGLVALAQGIQLLDHFRIDELRAQHDLDAGLPFVAGLGKFHDRIEGFPVRAACLELKILRWRFAAAELLEQLLEAVCVLRADHVQQRQAFDFLEILVTEHFQIRLIGTDVHAFVDVGDGIARGGDERVAAALGFAQRRLQSAHLAAAFEDAGFALDHQTQMLGAPAQGEVACALGEDVVEVGFVGLIQ